MWTRISVKKKKKKKDLLGCGCERVDALACGHELDADDCEDKEEKKKRKETLTGCRSWSWMVVDVWNAQMASSGGAVDDSAHVSLYLEIFVRVCAATHITNLLPNISISVKYYTITTQYHPFC